MTPLNPPCRSPWARHARRAAVSRGVTLLESLAALAVVAVLAGAGAPSMANWVYQVRLGTLAQELAVDLDFARSAAVAQDQRATACKAAPLPHAASEPACADSGDWSQGWLVFEDRNENGVRDVDEPVRLQRNALPDGWKAFGNTTVASYVSYTPLGVTRLVQGGFQAGTITVCRNSAGPIEARRVIVNSAGRPRVAKVMLESC